MTLKRVPLVTNEFYHVFNKSVGEAKIFNNLKYLDKILNIVDYYRFNQDIRLSQFHNLGDSLQKNYLRKIQKTSPLIDIFSFSFMPNHYHLLVKQLQNNGIKKFISNAQNSFAKYFNLINNREGSLFLNSFKYKRITSEEAFIHICRYIHLNPVTSFIIDLRELANYPFSSYSWYLNTQLNRFVNTTLLMDHFTHFKTLNNFIKFHENQVDYQRKLKEIKDLLFE
jgi:putative transposase